MLRNTAGQKWRVIAFSSVTQLPVTGDAANITARISIDYGARVATTDVNPTEAEDGYYYFDLSRAETNGYLLELFPESSTPNVIVLGGYRTTVTPPAVPSGGQNIAPTEVLFGYAPSGSDMDFFCYNDAKEVWNGSAFVVWNAADFASYRVPATEIESTGQYTATPPAGTVTYELRDRGASLALSYARWFWVPTSVACGFGTAGSSYDFYAYRNNQVWNGTAFVDWDDADYLDYRIAATELTGSGRFYPSVDIPTSSDRYEMRVRGVSLAASLVQFEGDYFYIAPANREAIEGTITAFIGETLRFTVDCSQTLTGLSLKVVVEDYLGAEIAVITSVSVSGSTATFELGTPVTDAVNQYPYSIRNTSGNVVMARGLIVVQEAATED